MTYGEAMYSLPKSTNLPSIYFVVTLLRKPHSRILIYSRVRNLIISWLHLEVLWLRIYRMPTIIDQLTPDSYILLIKPSDLCTEMTGVDYICGVCYLYVQL